MLGLQQGQRKPVQLKGRDSGACWLSVPDQKSSQAQTSKMTTATPSPSRSIRKSLQRGWEKAPSATANSPPRGVLQNGFSLPPVSDFQCGQRALPALPYTQRQPVAKLTELYLHFLPTFPSLLCNFSLRFQQVYLHDQLLPRVPQL